MNQAKGVGNYSLKNITIQRADGTSVNLGEPGTFAFKIRRAKYIFDLKRKGLI